MSCLGSVKVDKSCVCLSIHLVMEEERGDCLSSWKERMKQKKEAERHTYCCVLLRVYLCSYTHQVCVQAAYIYIYIQKI